jgi:uncharacterized protein with PIN domain
MKQTIHVNEASNQTPICPHCEKEIHSISSQKIKAGLGVRFVYFCASCRKVLGISHRKGFWMG